MDSKEYIETLVVKGKMVNVGLDDYGQCYFFEYVDDKGELRSVGCGTYNLDYKQEIEDYFESTQEILVRMVSDINYKIIELQRELNKVDKRFNKIERKVYGNRKKKVND